MQVILSGVEEIGAYAIEKLLQEQFNLKIVGVEYDSYFIREHENLKSEDAAILQSNTLRTISSEDYLFALTNDYATNLLTCKVAKEQNAKITVATVKRGHLDSEQDKKLQSIFGVDVLLNTASLVANLLVNLLNYPLAVDVYKLANDELIMLGFPVQRVLALANLSVEEIEDYFLKHDLPIQVSFVYSNYIFQQATKQIRLQPTDTVYFLLHEEYCSALYHFLEVERVEKNKKQKIVINGGGQIGVAIAELLPKDKYSISIIEIDEARSVHIAKKLAYARVLNFDGLDKEIMQMENLENADYFLSVTQKEAVNITSCLNAFGLGISKCIPLLSQPSFFDILRTKKYIYTSLSPRNILIRFLLNLLRKPDFLTYIPLFNSTLVICEVKIKSDSTSIGKTLGSLGLCKEIKTLLVLRNHKYITANMDLIIEGEDRLILTGNTLELQERISFL